MLLLCKVVGTPELTESGKAWTVTWPIHQHYFYTLNIMEAMKFKTMNSTSANSQPPPSPPLLLPAGGPEEDAGTSTQETIQTGEGSHNNYDSPYDFPPLPDPETCLSQKEGLRRLPEWLWGLWAHRFLVGSVGRNGGGYSALFLANATVFLAHVTFCSRTVVSWLPLFTDFAWLPPPLRSFSH